MSFGDWELFKMLVLGLREQELSQDDDLASRKYRYSTQQSDSLSQQQQPESLSDNSDISFLPDGTFSKRGK